LVIQYANLDEGKAKVRVTDMLGNIVLDNEIYISSGNNNYLLELQNLVVGIYNIQFTTGNIVFNKRVVKN
jgi:hypothetical protein